MHPTLSLESNPHRLRTIETEGSVGLVSTWLCCWLFLRRDFLDNTHKSFMGTLLTESITCGASGSNHHEALDPQLWHCIRHKQRLRRGFCARVPQKCALGLTSEEGFITFLRSNAEPERQPLPTATASTSPCKSDLHGHLRAVLCSARCPCTGCRP